MSARAVYCVVLLMGVAMYGCATPYQPKGLTGGYSDAQIDSNTYRVAFKGNGYTSREKVNNYLLVRCAEITVESGHDYFIILDSDTERKHSTYTTQGYYTGSTTGYATASGNMAYGTATTHGTYTPGQTFHHSKYGASAMIKVYNGEKPTNDPNAFDGREVMKYLGSQIKRKDTKASKAPTTAGPVDPSPSD